ncbi:diacylglycerol kinase [Alsobacter soli]|uniref:Diacylglycerol kinase n=1 Tax=Alsobacter soli TaxID=2109933 RepID=A0A2T1HUX1_9HYPH|nr:diacylglycerol kinase [Alsobacter soli]PSC05447.1 diacylglycerol kinase [Alsobacter soli]
MTRWLSAFRNSANGLRWAFRHECAVREEAITLALGALLAALIAPDFPSYCVLVGALALLLAVELLNTAIEKLADFITLERQPAIGVVKDLGSAAVFVMLALNALVWIGMAARALLG